LLPDSFFAGDAILKVSADSMNGWYQSRMSTLRGDLRRSDGSEISGLRLFVPLTSSHRAESSMRSAIGIFFAIPNFFDGCFKDGTRRWQIEFGMTFLESRTSQIGNNQGNNQAVRAIARPM